MLSLYISPLLFEIIVLGLVLGALGVKCPEMKCGGMKYRTFQ